MAHRLTENLKNAPYRGTPYDYSGFNASFENALGTISIAGKEYQVYLDKCEVNIINMGCGRGIDGMLHGDKIVSKRKFTLIEV